MLLGRSIGDTTPPPARSKQENNPTLLFTWWCTGFSLVIILFRLAGRWVRTERLFREDKVMALSIIPLLARMGFIHVVLIYGTNNVDASGLSLEDIEHRRLGSRLVLAGRIFYALFIWTAKFTISEFLKRMTDRFWKRTYEMILRSIRVFLGVTFFAVVIATLAECQPFPHYWQVVPDPGPQCRLGYGHLMTMGVSDMITDVMLIAFPIPIIIKSAMPMKRKISLILLFSLSAVLIGITGARMANVVERHGSQQYRTVWASSEILAAAAVSNALILGSFLRDRGVKKAKYKFGSTSDSIERASSRRPTVTALQWGSDEDLIRDTNMGYRLDPELHEHHSIPRPAPAALPASPGSVGRDKRNPFADKNWQFPDRQGVSSRDSEESDLKVPVPEQPMPSPREIHMSSNNGNGGRRNVNFFDVGGLLEDGATAASSPHSSLA
ncbi:hypothetical protein BDY21DRAFT_274924, partial [Lineolata rhizophorae]